jgi:glycosyltransferase involved in cell wall biosynthesis
MKFSIITAIKNAKEEIIDTIISLENQSYKDFEWLICDGGNSSEILFLIESSKIQNKRVVSSSDTGISDAWNKGLQFSNGNYVGFLNAGDTYRPEFLSRLAELSDLSILCAHAEIVRKDGTFIKLFRAEPNRIRYGMYIPHNWMFVKRTLFYQVGDFRSLEVSMDYEWTLRLFKIILISDVGIIDETMGDYKIGGISDLNYIKSFYTNKIIMDDAGYNRFINYLIFLVSVTKHFVWMRVLK